MARVIYSDDALADFERIIEFLLEVTPNRASKTIEIIMGAVDSLEHHPLIGRKRDTTRRELVISQGRTGYIALYRYDPVRDFVFVLRLRHQREAGFID